MPSNVPKTKLPSTLDRKRDGTIARKKVGNIRTARHTKRRFVQSMILVICGIRTYRSMKKMMSIELTAFQKTWKVFPLG